MENQDRDKPIDSPPPAPADPGYREIGMKRNGRDASVRITVSEDGMEATADFHPPRGDGDPLSRDWLYNQLSAFGVAKGMDEEAIDRALSECNLDRKTLSGVRIAAGKRPVDEVQEHIVLEERFRRTAPQLDPDSPKVDYKAVSPFLMVSKNERIGRVEPLRAGEDGYDVRGTAIAHGKESVALYELGEKTRQVGDEILTDSEGRLVIQNGKRLAVEEVLEVKGMVDYHTGHIAFPGDILLDAGIEPGFKVYSGGSILCKNTIDATDVNAKKDLLVQGGIIGRQEARVRVGGRLEARFVENCKVAVRGDAAVSGAIMNSLLYTLGKLDMGDSGRIAGGEVRAAKGLRAARLGVPSGQKLSILCGMDFVVQQKVDFIKERLRVLVAKALKADGLYRTRPSPALDAIRREIQAMQAQLLSSLADFESRLDVDPGATVEVKGQVFPGVTIVICRHSLTVTEEMKGVRFLLDPSREHLVREVLR